VNSPAGGAPIEQDSLQPLTAKEFDQIRRLAFDKFGLDLRTGKEYLVAARLGKVLREARCRSFREYYRHVLADGSGQALIGLIDSLTTNYTSFFREPAHFDFLAQHIAPEWRNRDSIPIWSAACSTGEEPYSIAFRLLDSLGARSLGKFRILATDISARVLAAAQKAVYPADRFGDLAPDTLRKYVLRGERSCQGLYRIRKEIASVVSFRRLNLVQEFPRLGLFPLIFCRNVMIYFNKSTQADVVKRLVSCLEPGGYLFIGHAENLTGMDCGLQYVQPAIYRKPAGTHGPIAKENTQSWD
jgi:chemotaxis protein methyltransferase CheR